MIFGNQLYVQRHRKIQVLLMNNKEENLLYGMIWKEEETNKIWWWDFVSKNASKGKIEKSRVDRGKLRPNPEDFYEDDKCNLI